MRNGSHTDITRNGRARVLAALIVLVLGIGAVEGYQLLQQGSTVPPIIHTEQSNSVTSGPDSETLDGVAYESPNQGEGMSVQYTQYVGGQTYHPFQPLQYFLTNSTNVINRKSQKLAFNAIKAGDHLVVQMSRPICVTGPIGGKSGCQFTIYTIQDLSR